jgi:hypothetical protein
MDRTLKPIRATAIPAALDKARVYRLLNEPEQAESICLDVLKVEPKHEEALKMLILSLTDQFPSRSGSVKRARARVAQLTVEYDRLYHAGLVREREARAHLSKGVSAAFAYDLFVEAIDYYDRAALVDHGLNDDPVLRRNSCLRTIEAERLEPLDETNELPLE